MRASNQGPAQRRPHLLDDTTALRQMSEITPSVAVLKYAAWQPALLSVTWATGSAWLKSQLSWDVPCA
jgi:hypothetical protein